MRERLHVSLVVDLTDDFTGKRPETARIRVSVEGAAPPIRKREGYYIFTNLNSDAVTVFVSSPMYQPVKRRVVLSGPDWNTAFVRIRLQPGRAYPNRDGATVVCGRTQPLRKLLFAALEGSPFYRLMADCGGCSQELTIFHPQSEDLEGRSFLMWQKGMKEYETTRIIKAFGTDPDRFLLAEPLEKIYKKAGTRLYPVYQCSADEEGGYFLLIPSLTGEKTELVCTWQSGEKRESASFEVVVGRENQRDM